MTKIPNLVLLIKGLGHWKFEFSNYQNSKTTGSMPKSKCGFEPIQ